MSRVIRGLAEADYLRAARAKAKAEGRCGMCRSRPAKAGCVTCAECIEMCNLRRRAKELHNPDRGMCIRCRQPIAAGSSVMCEAHMEKHREKMRARYQRRLAAGACPACGGVRDASGVYCRRCLQRVKEARAA